MPRKPKLMLNSWGVVRRGLAIGDSLSLKDDVHHLAGMRIRLLAIAALLAAPAAAQTSPPAWTRGATCYEIFVRSFQDSNGDGIGDINGLISRLDYLNDGNPATKTDLGVTALWLMPVFESPSYHGYDTIDYKKIEQ